ncbi:MAG: FABP family protein [Ilumatobacter sp.]|nr:FABP family protein [Ilumatobacter sp.]
MDLHPDVAPLAGLLGTWVGRGHGEYPTIEPFDYEETVTFAHVGKPFLRYEQRTRAIVDGQLAQPLHAETGYWRCTGGGALELVVSHPTGINEIEVGVAGVGEGGGIEIELRSTMVALSPSAKPVTELRRSFRLQGDVLSYRVAMAAVGRPLQHHLAAELRRTSP